MTSVTVEQDGHVLLIGVDRASKRNAWNLDVICDVAAAYERIAEDDEIRVGVLLGHGEHFSAGLDMTDVLSAVERDGPSVLAGEGNHDPYGVWRPPVPKPVVMAVQGIAFTLSIEQALASDIVVAADDVRFRQLEVGRPRDPAVRWCDAARPGPARLGQRHAVASHRRGVRRGRGAADRPGQEVVPARTQVQRAVEIARVVAAQAPLGVCGTLANARIASRRTYPPAPLAGTDRTAPPDRRRRAPTLAPATPRATLRQTLRSLPPAPRTGPLATRTIRATPARAARRPAKP